jgi:hypothetical protein
MGKPRDFAWLTLKLLAVDSDIKNDVLKVIDSNNLLS